MFSAWVAKWINQIAHVGWGIVIASFMAEMFSLSVGAIAIVGFAAVKEFMFDKFTASGPRQFSDSMDFAFWMIGGGVGLVAAFVVRHRLL